MRFLADTFEDTMEQIKARTGWEGKALARHVAKLIINAPKKGKRKLTPTLVADCVILGLIIESLGYNPFFKGSRI